MTDNIGEHMTDEELHEAQPAKDFTFQLVDTHTKLVPREVVVPNWIARDGHWGDVHNALSSAREGNMATATERIVRALERARGFGRQEAEDEMLAGHRATVTPEDSDAFYAGLRDYGRGRTSTDIRQARQKLNPNPRGGDQH